MYSPTFTNVSYFCFLLSTRLGICSIVFDRKTLSIKFIPRLQKIQLATATSITWLLFQYSFRTFQLFRQLRREHSSSSAEFYVCCAFSSFCLLELGPIWT